MVGAYLAGNGKTIQIKGERRVEGTKNQNNCHVYNTKFAIILFIGSSLWWVGDALIWSAHESTAYTVCVS